MNIDRILERISDRCDKDKKYLKGLFTKNKNEITEQFGEALPEERIDMLSLIRVGKQYDITKTQIDEFISMNVDKVVKDETNDDEMITMDEALDDIFDDLVEIPIGKSEEVKVLVKKTADLSDYFGDIPDPINPKKSEEFERKPVLDIQIGPKFYLQLIDPSRRPYAHEFDGKWGPYTKHAIDVTLIKVSDADLYDEKFDYGDFKGKDKYVDGQNYTLWMDDKCAGFYKLFWAQTSDDGLPDDRVFTLKWTKPKKYNNWTFKEA